MDTKNINKVSTKLYRSEYQPHELLQPYNRAPS